MAQRLNSRTTVVQDEVASVLSSIAELTGKQVLVGIPEADAARDDEDPQINNAVLGYLHENGSPATNLPARPWLVPGVTKSLPESIEFLKAAATAATNKNATKVDQALQAAGMVAAGGAKREITEGNFVPLQPATVRNRRRSRGTKSMRKAEKEYMKLIADGMSPQAAQDATGIQPLLNTAQMRNAVTSVVREKE